MRAKLVEKRMVRNLRKRGLSYREIGREIKVSKSSISLWCQGIVLNPKQRERLKNKRPQGNLGALANKIKRKKEILEIREASFKEISQITDSDFKLLGAMLYWGEGDKKHSTGVTNSDPAIIRFMMKWFRKVCKVPENKFKVSIYYHAGQREDAIKTYWSKITGVPLSQFHKSIFKKEGTGHRKNVLYNGTCKIRICDEDLRHKILAWIEKIYLLGAHSSAVEHLALNQSVLGSNPSGPSI